MNERRRSAFLAMLFGYAGLMISLARNILLVPLYLQKIPLPEYGAWLATGGALALILINDFGLSGVVTQRISARYGAGESAALGRLAGSALAIGLVLSLGLTAISLLFVPFLPGLQGLTVSESHTVTICFVFAVAANGLGVLGATAASVIRSLQRVILGGWITLAAELANVVTIVVGLFKGHGLYALAAGLFVRSAILAVAGLIGVWIVCVRNMQLTIEIDPASIRDLIGESSRFFLSAVAIKLQAQASVFFVGAILGPASAAIYSLTARAYDTVIMVIALVNGSLLPSVTHLLGSGDVARFRVVVLRLVVFMGTLTGFAMTLTLVLNPAFLGLWVGKGAFGGQTVSILMAVALFVSPMAMVAYDALLAQGRFRLITRLFILTSALQIVLLLSLLRLGMWVAPFVSALTVCAWGLAFWKSVSSDIGLTGHDVRELLRELLRVVAVSIAGFLAFELLYPPVSSWSALVIEASVCGLCMAASYFAMSPLLRRITLEELGTTLRLFRA